MFKKNTLSAAVRVALMLSAATMMHGCVGDGDETTTNYSKVGGTWQSVNAPKGTVIGTVMDTNGNFIVGATVYLGTKKTTTNAGGTYQFNDVAVVSTTSLDGVATQAIQISIVPPAGYLGATVTVTPQAQIDGMASDADTGDATANQVTTFVQGYSAQAGTAVLPKLDAVVQGTLRNYDTGEIIASHDIGLDMVAVNGISQEQQQDGVTTSYATIPYVIQTDASGNFILNNVPNDSDLRFVVGGYSVMTVDANSSLAGKGVTTDDEVDEIVVGNVRAKLITALDDIDPYVIDVSNIAADNMLERDIDGTTGVTVYFSEVLADSADGNYEVVVYDDTNKKYVTVSGVTMAADHKSLTFTTSAPFDSGAVLKVSIARGDVKDIADNNLDVGGAHPDKFGYDTIVSSAVGTSYLQLTLQAWGQTNINAPAVDTALQQKVDTFGIDDVPDIQQLNPAFNDVWDNDPAIAPSIIQQLNSADNDDNLLGSDASERLTALMTALNGGTAIAVDTDNAQVTFDSTGATYYTFEVTRLNAPHTVTLDVLTPNMIDDGVDAFGNTKYVVTEEGQVAIVLGDVNPGDIMTITPYDDFENAGTPFEVTFVDNVEPTTVLQNSYGLGGVDTSNTDYGDGGELSNLASQLNGTPFLNVTMGLLDNINLGGVDLGVPNNLKDELSVYNTKDTTTSLPYFSNINVYDATAYTAFAGKLSRTVGVAFSEDIALTGTPSYNGTAALGGWAAHNDVVLNDASGTVNADLVDVTVGNVMTLANVDHDKVIDFSNAVEDNAGNPGTVAKVQVRDMMPPMVTNAVYTGDLITLTFNETIVPKVGDKLYFLTNTFDSSVGQYNTLTGVPNAGFIVKTITLSQATITSFTNKVGNKNVLEIMPQDWGGDLTWLSTFNLASYKEGGSVDKNHGVLHAWNIEDVYGNDMATVNAGVTPVSFAIYNDVGGMSVDGSASGFAAGATTYTFTYTSNHAIDLGVGVTSLDTAGVKSYFTLYSLPNGGGANMDAAISSATGTLSADKKTLTVSVTSAAITADYSFVNDTAFKSDYDATLSDTADTQEAN